MTTLVDATGSTLDRAQRWASAVDISARSALVTILGDTVAPLGGVVWLADLIALAEPFGFSERLVRTSMFRLAAEGWVESERVGRRSRYSLTEHGRRETAAAERRIYHHGDRPWDGSWTLVFLPDRAGPPDGGDPAELLRWRGFARMDSGVHARPNGHVAETRELLDGLGLDPAPPVALARFDGDGDAPAAHSPFRADSGLADAEEGYRRFAERYRFTIEALAPVEAFALRTMVVHDLRRARLRDPDLPAALLPADWVGRRAVDLAAQVYRVVTGPAWAWVTEITGLTIDPSVPPLSLRFAPRGSTP